ncbi:MAG: hypothetical protein WA005_09770 [Candidatus Binataceae bacterium]
MVEESNEPVSPNWKLGREPAARIVILGDAREEWPQRLAAHSGQNGRPFTIALVPDHAFDVSRAAIRAGADDVLPLPLDSDAMLRCLAKASELRKTDETDAAGAVCSIVSLSGGVGVTSLALGLGLCLRGRFEKKTVLVDLDLQAAPLAVLLNVEPEHTIAELADPTSAIDSIRLEGALSKTASGLYLLPPPMRIEEGELVSASTLGDTVDVLRHMFDVVLVDCGSCVSEGTITVWERCQYIFYILTQSVTGVRSAQRFLDLYRRLELRDTQVQFALNRYDPKHPLTIKEIAAALGDQIVAVLPRDYRGFAGVEAGGEVLWAGMDQELRSQLSLLAGRVLGVKEGGASRPGLLSRIAAAVWSQG